MATAVMVAIATDERPYGLGESGVITVEVGEQLYRRESEWRTLAPACIHHMVLGEMILPCRQSLRVSHTVTA